MEQPGPGFCEAVELRGKLTGFGGTMNRGAVAALRPGDAPP